MTNLKKLLIGGSLFIVVALLLWFAFFEYVVRTCKRELALIEQDLRHKGYEFSYKTIAYSGFFSSIDIQVHQLHLKDPQNVVTWQGEDVRVRVRPWNMRSLKITLSGDQTIALTALGRVRVAGAQGTLKLASHGKIEEASLVASQVFFANESRAPLPIYLQDFSLYLTNLSHPLEAHLSLEAAIKGLPSLPTGGDLPEDPLMLSFDATLSGFQPSHPVPHSLSAWREGGGVLDITHAQLAWPTMRIEGDGTFTFDQDMYPLASFSTRITNFQDVLHNMVLFGWVKRKQAPFIAFMANMLSQPDENGEPSLKAPLTLQNRAVFLGGIPVPLYKFK